ncbi:MAG: hypothetical protein ACR2IK_14450 [Chloroflexota bacterium]
MFGFADLRAQIGDPMGDPVTCEFSDPSGTGDIHQRTTTGLAFWRKSTNTPTFTNGFDHWAQTPMGRVTWTGASVDPPAQANPNADAYPAVIVETFTRACEDTNHDPALQATQRATCACAIDKIQQTYSLADFIAIGQQSMTGAGVPREVANIVVSCVFDQLGQ